MNTSLNLLSHSSKIQTLFSYLTGDLPFDVVDFLSDKSTIIILLMTKGISSDFPPKQDGTLRDIMKICRFAMNSTVNLYRKCGRSIWLVILNCQIANCQIG